MKSSSEEILVTGSDISNRLQGFDIYIPDILESNYEYFEDEKNESNIATSVAYGTNKNDSIYLENVLIVFVVSNECNGIAIMEYGIPIVGIYTGSLIDIKYNANLLIGTIYEDDFDVSRYERDFVYKNEMGTLSFTGKNNLLGLRDERILSFFLSELALRFLVLHEIGHHVKRHVAESDIRYATSPVSTFEKNTSNAIDNTVVNEIEFDEIELEADIWAANRMVEEFALLTHALTKNKSYLEEIGITSPFEIKLCALHLILYAITLAFSTLFSKSELSSQSVSTNFKLKLIAYRELSVLVAIIAGLHESCKDDFVLYFNEHSEEDKDDISRLHEGIAMDRFDLSDFAMYIFRFYTEGKRIYCRVNGVSDDKGYIQRYYDVFSTLHSSLIVE